MFVPLVDLLRCVNSHADTWLVASIDRAEERDIVAGAIGCPECLAEYPVRDGVVCFAEDVLRPPLAAAREEDAVRLAAALDLTDARMTAVLHGAWGALAPVVRGLSPAQLLLVNPPEGIASGDGISIVVAHTAPVALGAVDAVAIGADAADPMMASLVRCLRAGGRAIAPASVAVPAGWTELARDEEIWVAQSPADAATSPPIPITRRSRTANR